MPPSGAARWGLRKRLEQCSGSPDPVTIARATGERLVPAGQRPYLSGMTTRHRPNAATRRQLLISALALPVAGLARPAGAAPIALGEALRDRIAGLPLIRGAQLRPDDLVDRVTVVSFFASWCPPCRPEMAYLNQLLAETGPAPLTVIGINLFEDFGGRTNEATLDRFLDQTQPTFPILRGDKAAADAFGGVDRIPTVIVFDRSGGTAMRFVHQRGAAKTHLELDELRAAVAPLLAS